MITWQNAESAVSTWITKHIIPDVEKKFDWNVQLVVKTVLFVVTEKLDTVFNDLIHGTSPLADKVDLSKLGISKDGFDVAQFDKWYKFTSPKEIDAMGVILRNVPMFGILDLPNKPLDYRLEKDDIMQLVSILKSYNKSDAPDHLK